jgi:hypothetical protein
MRYPTRVSLLWTALAAALFTPCAEAAAPPARRRTELRVDSARKVVAAVVAAARRNRRLPVRSRTGKRPPFRRTGDALTEYYTRAAASAARKLPAHQAAPAFLLGLGVALDTSVLLRQNPFTRTLWRRVESDAERRERLKVLGTPTVHGRHDLAQHFAVSAALTAVSGARAAEGMGILKEMLDAEGGSGFSFADLAADLAGVAFGDRLVKKPALLGRVARKFRVADHVLSPRGLIEGLSSTAFAKRYGSVRDRRFQKALEDLRRRTRALPGYKADPR